ncbi:hypothetical protein L198_07693 [Cryptococcus wingfieldii CBS 7118]|uniref:Uncharacterized protein n=1 Tax=Cryptococcus wingfieldii CBS 7118 TaxID=1295528 RepID=A0A1E3I5K2_9TREE|nr:hypothetical protein L198_07693 [Cryptococcus wingfieldii CBS 7118]ODN83797.1 hypothetical protein L198_07693 [Cryptococcus wingfieldii CBS 7118]
MERHPLTALHGNQPPSPHASTFDNASRKRTKLAPIFARNKRAQPSSSPLSGQENATPSNSQGPRRVVDRSSPLSPTRFHIRNDAPSSLHSASTTEDSSDEEDLPSSVFGGHRRKIQHYFTPSTSSSSRPQEKERRVEPLAVVEPAVESSAWKRRRRRLGVNSRGTGLDAINLIPPQPPYLRELWHSLAPYHPEEPPSSLFLPSIHPPNGIARDYSPPLTITFSHTAKRYTSHEARGQGLRRLIAVGNEEGGLRIVDFDEGLGMHREEKGWWWRAHSNTVFDLKWSADDTRILTGSGDGTSRIHALTTPTPTLLATLRGHTASVKTVTFLDPTRSAEPSMSSSIVASSGRDGNILIFDVRTKGRMVEGSDDGRGSREGSRDRYMNGVPGWAAQTGGDVLDPVMTIKSAHGDRRTSSRSATRSVTSLLALNSIPGTLASGGSFDGIVKLWDLRFPAPTPRSPNPRPSCTSSGVLPDCTLSGDSPSKRPRSINAMVESPSTGDIYALCGDSKVHVIRPSAALSPEEMAEATLDQVAEAIQPQKFTHPDLLINSFYIRLSISPDGRYLATSSPRSGQLAWDTQSPNVAAETYGWKGREVGAMDWGKEVLAVSGDDCGAHLYRYKPEVGRFSRGEKGFEELLRGQDWMGASRQ